MRKKSLLIIGLVLLAGISFAVTDKEEAVTFYKVKGGAVHANKTGINVIHLTGIKSIKDEDLKYMTVFSNLTIVSLGNTSITSEGLIYLSGLKKLEALNLRGTKVDDKGMKYLKDLESLEDLDLVNTKVSDEGIQELASLENLRIIKLRGSKVTQKGIDKLKKKLPDCYITLETDEEIQ